MSDSPVDPYLREASWQIAVPRGRPLEIRLKSWTQSIGNDVRFRIEINNIEHPYLANKICRYSGAETRNPALQPAITHIMDTLRSALRQSIVDRSLSESIPFTSAEGKLEKIDWHSGGTDQEVMVVDFGLEQREMLHKHKDVRAAKPDDLKALFDDTAGAIGSLLPEAARLVDQHKDKHPPADASEVARQEYFRAVDSARATAVASITDWATGFSPSARPPVKPGRN